MANRYDVAYEYIKVRTDNRMLSLIDTTTLGDWRRLPRYQEQRMKERNPRLFLTGAGCTTGGFFPWYVVDRDGPLHLFESKRFVEKMVVREVPACTKTVTLNASYVEEGLVFEALTLMGGDMLCYVFIPKCDVLRGRELREAISNELESINPNQWGCYCKLKMITSRSAFEVKDFSTVWKHSAREQGELEVKRRKVMKQAPGLWFLELNYKNCSNQTMREALK
ncbi:unnamed protein product [Durusdinium trenchii]|uniref:Uncharacterized protein n=1 Tax=Durusdinium trenchii TaxID=1381693 RepID=A0ABP0SEA2_9DINO